jgi:glycosyltransferase involved in cell wall biosynthesis
MKILYYSPHPTHDIVSEVGYATHQREVILALKAMGHEVLPLIMGGTEASDLSPLARDTYQPSKLKSVVKKLIPSWLWTSFNNYKLRQHDKKAGERLRKALDDFKPDLIYERSEYLQDSGAKLASSLGIQYFLEVNAPFVEEMHAFEGYSLYHPLAHKIERYKLEKADKVFVVSTSLADFLVKQYQCNAEKIFVQPNCINPAKISVESDKIKQIRTKFSIGEKKVIGFVGSMFPYHGVDLLISAFADVHQTHPESILIVVGDGSILKQLKEQAVNLGIYNDVIFTGKIPHKEVFNYISAMDICIMARSNWYGSPVKLFEYGLMKKPIIAPDTMPVRDVMEHGQDALIIKDDVQSLKLALEQLLIDTTLSNQLADNFYQKVMAAYQWKHAANNIIKQCK